MSVAKSINKLLRVKTITEVMKASRGFEKIYALASLEDDEKIKEVAPFLQAVFRGKLMVRRARRSADTILHMMHGWATCGQIVLASRMFYFRVRAIQHWWRKYRDIMYANNRRVYDRFIVAETKFCTELFDRDNASKLKRKQSVGPRNQSKMALSRTERIKLMLTDGDTAREFVAQEMRVYRFKHLAKLAEHKILYAQFLEEHRDWMGEKEASDMLDQEFDKEKHPEPVAPRYPLLRLSDEDLTEMMKRCRRDPEDVSVIETSHMMRVKRSMKQEQDRREQELLESMSAKTRKAEDKLSARDYLPRIPHQEGPDAPLMSLHKIAGI
jgi:hypothetical protein